MKRFILLFVLVSIGAFSSEPYKITEEMKKQVVTAAIGAREKAYAPYSKYLVGAALLSSSGKIFTGCNVENASYGLVICAERAAIFKAISENDKNIQVIAVVTKDGGMPCGACRQVINEFNPKTIIIAANEKGKILFETSLEKLLPSAFGPANLQ